MYNWIVVIDKLNHFQKFAWVEAHRIRPKAWGVLIKKNTLPAIAMVQSTINLNAAMILEVPFFFFGGGGGFHSKMITGRRVSTQESESMT